MKVSKEMTRTETIPRTIRFPQRLRQRLVEDAERCGRSFEAQVIAILRHHYGEDVDIAPVPEAVVALARASMAGMTPGEQRLVTFDRPGGMHGRGEKMVTILRGP